ncbi:MAG: hypothetical protein SV375_12660, partial [Thermodesulfobacteriota bacterium]|nr:hypothetical protein [Thermodesulfobacteriota bacterium]
ANAIDDFSITNHAYGVYVPIQLAKGLSLTPVVMHYEEGDWETTNPAQPEYDMGSQTIYGFQLMVRF